MPTSSTARPGSFKDYFSDDSASYSQHRPGYPGQLFSTLSSLTKGHDLALDCATGSGQAAVGLARHFDTIIATDASQAQINNAQRHDKVIYFISRAENVAIQSNSLDLISAAQALHWFDPSAFAAEVDRTLKKGGILAAWTYQLLTVQPDIDQQINYLYSKLLGRYWPAERRLVEQGYASISFPFDELSMPKFSMELEWSLDQLLDYLSTWSAVKAYLSKNNENPIEMIHDRLLPLWGNRNSRKQVTWPLAVRAWQKS